MADREAVLRQIRDRFTPDLDVPDIALMALGEAWDAALEHVGPTLIELVDEYHATDSANRRDPSCHVCQLAEECVAAAIRRRGEEGKKP